MIMKLKDTFPRDLHVTTSQCTKEVDESNGELLEYTLFLIRHGEASHNVVEKLAKKKAIEEALAEGLSEDDQETERRIEEARQEVLLDDTLFDAPLSDLGIEQAKNASLSMQQIYSDYNLKPPEQVLVSPLTRTLETTSILFPENDNIHVREELRERCTGKPPDNRSPACELQKRQSFKRFSMTELVQLAETQDTGTEDKATLRERTKRLFQLVAKFPQQNIAVVTHKGYLRELERGPFSKPLASEFDNCEIRVYRIRFHAHDNDSLDYANRIV